MLGTGHHHAQRHHQTPATLEVRRALAKTRWGFLPRGPRHSSLPHAQQGQYTSVIYGYIKSGKYASALQILQAELQVRFRKGGLASRRLLI